MKPKTIIGLVVLLGFASLLFLNFGDQVGGYMSFEEASETGARAHVVGQWVQTEQTQYDPAQNLFTFYMKDDRGAVRQVRYANPKPASFEDAEKLVVEGYLQGDVFEAEHILMKCPSKYNDQRGLEQAQSAASGG
jgi:cytochrome c-type biogenesis protein CcmE